MKYDLAIVGGGIVGYLTALRCTDAGLRCVVIEAVDYLRSASAHSAGGIYTQLHHGIGQYQSDQFQNAITIVPLLKETTRAWLRLRQRLPDIPLEITGGMVVGCTEEDIDNLREKHYVERHYAMRTEMVDSQCARTWSADLSRSVRGGTYAIDEGHCLPVPLLRQAKSEFIRSGGTVMEGTAVVAIEKANHGVVLSLSLRGEIHAQQAVLACGAFLDRFLGHIGIARHVTRLPIQMLVIRNTTACIPHLTRRVGRKLSVKRVDSRHLWIGGGWPMDELAPEAWVPQVSQESVKANVAEAIAVFPSLSGATVTEAWGSFAAWTTDGLPMIGPLSTLPGVFMALGGNGYSLGPLYSEVLSDLVLDHPVKFDLTSFSPDRYLCPKSIANTTYLVPD